MVQMFGESGALTDLFLILKQNNAYFDSLESILTFKDNWQIDIENYKDERRIALLEEIPKQKVSLEEYLFDYESKIKDRKQFLLKEKEDIKIRLIKYSEKTNNPIKAIYYFLRHKQSIRRQKKLEYSFDKELHRPFEKLDKKIQNTKNHISYKENNIEKIVEIRSERYISNIQRIKSILDSLYPLISGAIGEEKAIEELQKLSNSFYVINDFKLRFDPPIYNRRENDRIHSIQVDHLVIGPSGIFLIETKNWSKKSVESLDLFSPVKQIRRSSYALFSILNKTKNISLSKHHWGEKKIPTRNILLMINEIPKEEFQYVKILSLHRLQNYLTYFDQIFSDKDVKAIFNNLMI